jgi:hypothetical protein
MIKENSKEMKYLKQMLRKQYLSAKEGNWITNTIHRNKMD